MELKIYNGEYFERGKTRYLIFAVIILLVVVLSILSNNIIGGVFVFLIAGGYIFYLTKTNDIIKMVAGKNALQIDKVAYTRNTLKGFVLEYHTKKQKIHNIVIIDNKKDAKIFTINDTDENIDKFVKRLNDYIPMLENYDQGTLDKFLRKIKL